jgi:hypothetical protein
MESIATVTLSLAEYNDLREKAEHSEMIHVVKEDNYFILDTWHSEDDTKLDEFLKKLLDSYYDQVNTAKGKINAVQEQLEEALRKLGDIKNMTVLEFMRYRKDKQL